MKQKTAEKILELVQRNYQEIAKGFDLTRRKELWPEIREFAQSIEDGARVLDVGCGNGRLLEALKGKKVDYLGLDNSSELIKIARRTYPNQKFLIGDILNLSAIKEKNFDYIFCLAVLPHIPGHSLRVKALHNLNDKLGVDGRLIVSVWNFWKRSSKKKYRRLLLAATLKKLRGRSELDFGDLIFPWRGQEGMNSLRYYHAFTKLGLRSLILFSRLKLLSLKSYGFNYWLILKKKYTTSF